MCPTQPTGEKEAHLSSLSATPFEIGLVWKGLRIYFLALTSKLRWMLDLELQGLHFYYYYNIRASWPCVYKCPMTANSLAWGCSRRLCLHRSVGLGERFATGLQAQEGLIQSHGGKWRLSTWGAAVCPYFWWQGICLVGNGHWPHNAAMLKHSENAEKTCDSEGLEEAARR